MILSIIIPCYNSENFLAKTLNMLLAQGLKDCEVIIINDGSADKTSEIAHTYENDYPFFTVIDKQNEGVSVARNIGIQAAQGKFVYFLDSDDTLADGTIDFFKKIIKENQKIQFFGFGYKSIDENNREKKYNFVKYDKKEIDSFLIKKLFLTKRITFHICSCIFDRQFLISNNITFTRGQKIGEDVCFLLTVLHFANLCYYSKRECFIYQIRNDSALQRTQGYNLNKFQALISYEKTLSSLYNDKVLSKYTNFFYQIRLFNHLRTYLSSSLLDDDLCKEFTKRIIKFKERIAFGELKCTLVLILLHFVPSKYLEKLLNKRKRKSIEY